MNSEERFYEELSRVPEMPSDIYEKVMSNVSRRSSARNTLLALAASLILAVGYFNITKDKPENVVIQPVIADELQSISDYLNGGDLEQEFDTYALISGF